MRKTKFLALTAALCLLFGTQAMAAPSRAGDVSLAKYYLTATVQSGSSSPREAKVDPRLQPVSETDKTKMEVKVNEKANELLGTQNPNVYLFDAYLVLSGTEIKCTLASGSSVTLEFNVPNVKPGSKVKVLHWANGIDSEPEVLGATPGEGTVAVTFTSLSPIAILVDNSSVTPPQDPTPDPAPEPAPDPVITQDTSGRVSPKTAETAMIYVLEAAVVLSFVGLVVFTRKEHK